MSPGLQLIDLRRRFGDVVALDGVSLDADEGSMVGFVGPNGAGKTTAMRIALGVLEADGGEVRWQGRVVDETARRRFGYIPEERGLYPKMRVLEQLVYLARLHGVSRAAAQSRAQEILETLGVATRSKDRVESLSLGNQQRVQLAAALVHEPDVLVLDEPFSGLDPVGTDVLIEVLDHERRARGVPIVFSSHQLELVERVCDRVAMIVDGRIVTEGAIDELRESRARRLVRVEVEGAPADWFGSIPGVRLEGEVPGGLILELGNGTDDQRVLDLARSIGEVRHFSLVRPTLAQLFREVVSS
ncbi:MAG TPA: ATP-binding cassette domain-containing protein [Actinomycetota bacterium]|nr:ATP-binding cassette domain-containing protein [Actinomycetota bacterium]